MSWHAQGETTWEDLKNAAEGVHFNTLEEESLVEQDVRSLKLEVAMLDRAIGAIFSVLTAEQRTEAFLALKRGQ
jgi:hypothetical protein